MTEPIKYLYGMPHAEDMDWDPQTVYEKYIEDYVDDHDRRPREIEEWTATGADVWLMHTDLIIEHVVEMSSDELGDGGYEHLEKAGKSDDVVAAFEAARALMASKVTYLMADKKIKTMTVTWNEEGEPLLDGEPMYVKKAATT